MSFLDSILGPITPEAGKKELEIIQPAEKITATTRNGIASVLEGVGVATLAPVSAVGAAGESVSFNAAKITGVIPVGLNRIGKGFSMLRSGPINAVRKGIRNLLGTNGGHTAA